MRMIFLQGWGRHVCGLCLLICWAADPRSSTAFDSAPLRQDGHHSETAAFYFVIFNVWMEIVFQI